MDNLLSEVSIWPVVCQSTVCLWKGQVKELIRWTSSGTEGVYALCPKCKAKVMATARMIDWYSKVKRPLHVAFNKAVPAADDEPYPDEPAKPKKRG